MKQRPGRFNMQRETGGDQRRAVKNSLMRSDPPARAQN